MSGLQQTAYTPGDTVDEDPNYRGTDPNAFAAQGDPAAQKVAADRTNEKRQAGETREEVERSVAAIAILGGDAVGVVVEGAGGAENVAKLQHWSGGQAGAGSQGGSSRAT